MQKTLAATPLVSSYDPPTRDCVVGDFLSGWTLPAICRRNDVTLRQIDIILSARGLNMNKPRVPSAVVAAYNAIEPDVSRHKLALGRCWADPVWAARTRAAMSKGQLRRAAKARKSRARKAQREARIALDQQLADDLSKDLGEMQSAFPFVRVLDAEPGTAAVISAPISPRPSLFRRFVAWLQS